MKFIHISDLHLGKYLYGYSMIDQGDQSYWINQFLKVVDEEKPNAVLIAGDIYDRSVAPRDAIKLFGDFITSLSSRKIPILIIAGNHDSGIRLASMHQILKQQDVYIAGEITKNVEHVTLKDEYGDVTFWLVPYLFPAAVEQALDIKGIKDYSEAMKLLLENQDIDFSKRNVILSHQTINYAGKEPERGGSEEMIGGISGINQSVYDGFDYVALGHIHAAQSIGKDSIRYSGSPLCYHFDEVKKPKKGPVIVEMKEKNMPLSIHICEIEPLHKLREVTGTFDEIVKQEKKNSNKEEYIKVVLTDDYIPTGVANTLDALFKEKDSILMTTEHKPSRIYTEDITVQNLKEISLEESFIEFYKEKRNGEYPSVDEQKIIQMVCEQIINSNEDKPGEPSNQDIDDILNFVYGLEESK